MTCNFYIMVAVDQRWEPTNQKAELSVSRSVRYESSM